jgi:hypothetical protein
VDCFTVVIGNRFQYRNRPDLSGFDDTDPQRPVEGVVVHLLNIFLGDFHSQNPQRESQKRSCGRFEYLQAYFFYKIFDGFPILGHMGCLKMCMPRFKAFPRFDYRPRNIP